MTGGLRRHPCVSAARAVFPSRRRDRRSSQNESFFGRCKCATEPVRLTILLAAHLLQPLHVEGQRLWPGPRVERAAREAALADQEVVHDDRSEEHTSELQSLMRMSYAVFCLKKKTYALH